MVVVKGRRFERAWLRRGVKIFAGWMRMEEENMGFLCEEG